MNKAELISLGIMIWLSRNPFSKSHNLQTFVLKKVAIQYCVKLNDPPLNSF